MFRRVFAPVTRLFQPSPARLQYENDMQRLYLFTEHKKLLNEFRAVKSDFSLSNIHEEVASKVLEKSKTVSLNSKLAILKDSIEDQVTKICQSIENAERGALFVKQSNISDAGQGVFSRSNLDPGTVVCFYPGTVYHMDNIRDIPGFPNLNNDKLLSCYDGTILDASNVSLSDDVAVDEISLCAQSYAVGHILNHPPKGILPHVLGYEWKVPLNPLVFPEKFRQFIPNHACKNNRFQEMFGQHKNYWINTMVFVTIRQVYAGDEIFLNYRYNPHAQVKAPSWYFPVNVEEDARRWALK